MTAARGIRRDRGNAISSCEDNKRDRSHTRYRCQRPDLSSAFTGVINRVKIVRGGLETRRHSTPEGAPMKSMAYTPGTPAPELCGSPNRYDQERRFWTVLRIEE